MTKGRHQKPMKGFRPGKEPPQLRKQRAKKRLEVSGGAQERLLELFSERTPDESRALIRRWKLGLLAGALIAGVVAVLLTGWSTVAAVIVGTLALVLLVVWWRLHSQRRALELMIDEVGGR